MKIAKFISEATQFWNHLKEGISQVWTMVKERVFNSSEFDEFIEDTCRKLALYRNHFVGSNTTQYCELMARVGYIVSTYPEYYAMFNKILADDLYTSAKVGALGRSLYTSRRDIFKFRELNSDKSLLEVAVVYYNLVAECAQTNFSALKEKAKVDPAIKAHFTVVSSELETYRMIRDLRSFSVPSYLMYSSMLAILIGSYIWANSYNSVYEWLPLLGTFILTMVVGFVIQHVFDFPKSIPFGAVAKKLEKAINRKQLASLPVVCYVARQTFWRAL